MKYYIPITKNLIEKNEEGQINKSMGEEVENISTRTNRSDDNDNIHNLLIQGKTNTNSYYNLASENFSLEEMNSTKVLFDNSSFFCS